MALTDEAVGHQLTAITAYIVGLMRFAYPTTLSGVAVSKPTPTTALPLAQTAWELAT